MNMKPDTGMSLRRRLSSGVATAGLLARDTNGNMALLTAVMLIPILGMAGLGIDFWTKTNAKAELDAAADAATLAAITRASEFVKSGQSASSAVVAGRAAGLKQFAGNAGKIPMADAGPPQIELAVVGQKISAKLSWTATSKTTFGSVVGVKSLALSGESTGEVTMPDYVKIIMLLDNSASMGIGATHEEQRKIHNQTGNCALACHQPEAFKNAPGYAPGETSYGRAAAAGIQTRVDVLKGAIEKITYEAQEAMSSPRQIKIGLYTYNSKPEQILSVDDPKASDRTAVRRAAAAITLARDGVESYLSYTGGHWNPLPHTNYQPSAGYSLPDGPGIERAWYLQAINPEFCNRLKVSDVKVVPLQVSYIIPEGTFQDKDVRFPWIDNTLLRSRHVDNSFAACASDKKHAFKGTTPEEITDSVMEMFRLTLPRNARLAK